MSKLSEIIYLPFVWGQVDINSLPLSVDVEKDKGELVPVVCVVNLPFNT